MKKQKEPPKKYDPNALMTWREWINLAIKSLVLTICVFFTMYLFTMLFVVDGVLKFD